MDDLSGYRSNGDCFVSFWIIQKNKKKAFVSFVLYLFVRSLAVLLIHKTSNKKTGQSGDPKDQILILVIRNNYGVVFIFMNSPYQSTATLCDFTIRNLFTWQKGWRSKFKWFSYIREYNFYHIRRRIE